MARVIGDKQLRLVCLPTKNVSVTMGGNETRHRGLSGSLGSKCVMISLERKFLGIFDEKQNAQLVSFWEALKFEEFYFNH